MSSRPITVPRRKFLSAVFTLIGDAHSYGTSVDVTCGPVLFTTDQLAIYPDSKVGAGDVVSQMRYVIENVRSILTGGAADLSDVLKLQLFRLQMRDFELASDVLHYYFHTDLPASR